ncbi:hypothetical protein, partial [[Clostridium] symbiosum]|uniref:hypothetical protein n=1 Tax=Clostridium symbiosum TaxID=1512 RepID=UPI001D08CA53
QVPCGIFFSRIPHRKVMAGTEDAKVFAIPDPDLRPLICSFSSRGGGYCLCHHRPSDAREPALYKSENCVVREPAFIQDE